MWPCVSLCPCRPDPLHQWVKRQHSPPGRHTAGAQQQQQLDRGLQSAHRHTPPHDVRQRGESKPRGRQPWLPFMSKTQTRAHTKPLKGRKGPVRTSSYLRLPVVTFGSLRRYNFPPTLKATNALKPNSQRVRQAPARNLADISKVWQHQQANAIARHGTTPEKSGRVSKRNQDMIGSAPPCGCDLHQSSHREQK